MTTQLFKVDPKDPQPDIITKAAEAIKKGGLVAFPTETVYGLGADFFDVDAIKRLCEVKQRPQGKPFTAHIADLRDLNRFDADVTPFARELIALYWPGPLTVLFDTKNAGKTGFRMPDNYIAQELINKSGTVLAAPSANISGQLPPANAQDVLEQLEGKIDIVLDGGPAKIGKESTIVDFTAFPYAIVREGAIPEKQIARDEADFWRKKAAPAIKKIMFVCTGNSCRSPMAEGYLKKRLSEVRRRGIEVISRGIAATAGMGATPETIDILKEAGVDMRNHCAAVLTDDDIESSDLILVMDERHREEIIDRVPESRHRVYLLGEFGLWGGRPGDSPINIMDPIGQIPRVYKGVFEQIKGCIERLVEIFI